MSNKEIMMDLLKSFSLRHFLEKYDTWCRFKIYWSFIHANSFLSLLFSFPTTINLNGKINHNKWCHRNDRMEPQCITCDIENTLWSSRRLYSNCSYFDVYLSPSSSIATDYRVEHYVLECQGPTLPVAGNPIIHIFLVSTSHHCIN